jgi:hypothetical protein
VRCSLAVAGLTRPAPPVPPRRGPGHRGGRSAWLRVLGPPSAPRPARCRYLARGGGRVWAGPGWQACSDRNPGIFRPGPKHARRSHRGAPPRASLLADQDRLKFWNARQSRLAMPGRPSTGAVRGRGSVGRASPCQGEGRGFESRRPLGGAGRRVRGRRSTWLPGTVFSPGDGAGSGGVAEWLRQGPAKPCTRVRFPPPPRGRLAQWESATLTR